MGRKSVNVCMAAAVTAAGVAAAPVSGPEFETMRAKLLSRPRQVLYNTDGCDALYFPANQPASAEALQKRRLVYTKGTRIDTVLYCPISSGFGHLTCRTKVGDQLLGGPTGGTIPLLFPAQKSLAEIYARTDLPSGFGTRP